MHNPPPIPTLWLLAIILSVWIAIERNLHVSLLLSIENGVKFLIVLLWWHVHGFCLYRLADAMECRVRFVSKPANLIGRRYLLFQYRHLRKIRANRQHKSNYGPKRIPHHPA